MTKALTFESNIHFKRGGRGAPKKVREGQVATQQLPPGRVPRISRLMALAIRFDGLIRASEVADFAQLARLAHVTRARITQIMNLLMLAPDIQEAILFLPRTERGHDRVHLKQLQPMTLVADWGKQRKMWKGQMQAAGTN